MVFELKASKKILLRNSKKQIVLNVIDESLIEEKKRGEVVLGLNKIIELVLNELSVYHEFFFEEIDMIFKKTPSFMLVNWSLTKKVSLIVNVDKIVERIDDEKFIYSKLVHEFTHLVDDKEFKKNSNFLRDIFNFWKRKRLNVMDDKKRVEKEGNYGAFFKFLEKIRSEGIANFNEGSWNSKRCFGESLEVRKFFLSLKSYEDFFELDRKFCYDVGELIFVVISFYWVIEKLNLAKKCGLDLYDEKKLKNIIMNYHNFGDRIELKLEFDVKQILVAEFSSWRINLVLLNYEKACNFFGINEEYRVLDNKLLKSIMRNL